MRDRGPDQLCGPASSQPRVLGFDGLRAIAFLMVFVSHKMPSPRTEAAGSAGVWLFFVLSGFLITRILLRTRERIGTGAERYSEGLIRFYVNRAARIAPVYFGFLLILSLLAGAGLVDLGEERRQVANWLFLSNLYIERYGWAGDLGHLWSLSVEEQYYLVSPVFALAMGRSNLARLAMLTIAVSFAAHAVFWLLDAGPIRFDVNSAINAGLLALGALTALAAERRLPGWLLHDGAIALVLAVYVALPLLVAPTGLWPVVGRLSGLLVALLLLQIEQAQASATVRLLEIPWISGIGIVSYGAYLFHPVIRIEALTNLHCLELPLTRTVTIGVDLCVTLLVAAGSWHFFEKPVRDWFRRPPLPATRPAIRRAVGPGPDLG